VRDLICDAFVTLDGFTSGAGSAAHFGSHGPELDRWLASELEQPQEVLLSGRTYAKLAAHSGGMSRDDPMNRRLSELPKVVFSGAPDEELAWGPTRRLRGDFGDRIRALKGEAGPPIRMIGSLKLVRRLLRDGLVDRLRLLVFPVVLGASGRGHLFDGLPELEPTLIGCRTLDGSVVLLEYRLAGS